MYDSICKFIAIEFSENIATWLLGKPISLTELKPPELSSEPIRVDSLIFLESDELVLHLEFQTYPDQDIPFRMLDYRVRLYRHYPQKEVIQIVVYLRENRSKLVNQTVFELSKTSHEFEVICLWEVPPETLLQSKGLWPFAVLSQGKNRETILRQISQKIDEISDPREKSNVTASTAVLAGLVLDQDIIQRLLRKDIMRESVIYQDILSEGREQGKEQGRHQEGVNLISRLLNRLIGQILPDLTQKIHDLSIEQLETLGDALLDFKSEEDLQKWFEENSEN